MHNPQFYVSGKPRETWKEIHWKYFAESKWWMYAVCACVNLTAGTLGECSQIRRSPGFSGVVKRLLAQLNFAPMALSVHYSVIWTAAYFNTIVYLIFATYLVLQIWLSNQRVSQLRLCRFQSICSTPDTSTNNISQHEKLPRGGFSCWYW